jgi:hypothetical protein
MSLEHQSDWKKERVERWIENGYGPEAVAVFGLSLEKFKEGIHKSHVPPNPPDLEYKKKLSKNGKKKLKYVYPIVSNIRTFRRGLADKIIEHFLHNELRQIVKVTARQLQHVFPILDYKKTVSIPDDLTSQSIKDNAAFYALQSSLMNNFEKATGLKVDLYEVVTATYRLWPEAYQQFVQASKSSFLGDIDEILRCTDEAEINKIIKTLQSNPIIKPEQWLNGRGVLVYLNPDIFEGGNDIVLAYEDDEELIIVSNNPLPDYTISGIEVLSDHERRELESTDFQAT